MRCFIVPDGGSTGIQKGYAQIIAIHAALLSNNKIVYFSGDQHDPGQFAHSLFDHARLCDCGTFAISSCTPVPGISDLFCCGHAVLGTGQLLIGGGTARFAGFEGAPQAWIFDPATSTFTATASMSDGRWYPTLLTLGSGSVVALSGLTAAGVDDNRNLEVWSPVFANWTVEGVLSYAMETLYPRAHLLPNSRVFFVTPMNGQCMTWRPGTATATNVCSSPFVGMGFSEYSSALLPLLPEEDYAPRILVANIEQPQIIDLSVASPSWSNTGPRNLVGALSTPPIRLNGTLTLLPTGEALSAGGEEQAGSEAHPVLALEIYRPASNSWVTLPASTSVARAYHSVALLMPDGRVWFAGSNKRCDWSFHNSADYGGMPEPTDLQEVVGGVPVDNRELRIEIFEPWYVGRGDRPTFSLGGVTSVGVGRSFDITSPQAATISRVALVRSGSCTHAFNPDQRYVGVPFTVSGTTLTVTLPDNENLLPPGPYLVFVLAQVVDADCGVLDVPSTGQFIQLVNSKWIKELKPEIDNIKEILEVVSKDFDVVDPGPVDIGDPAELLQQIAVAVDNMARTAGRSFIQPHERPLQPQVTAAQLAKVPIYPIDPAVLARQLSMEGMMERETAAAPGQKPTPQGAGMDMGGKASATDKKMEVGKKPQKKEKKR
jgi:hypothetical protein